MHSLWSRDSYTNQENPDLTLTLISIGLNSHLDISVRAVEVAKRSDKVYAETYTMKLETDPSQLSELIGKTVEPLAREALEENSDNIINEATLSDVAVLVGGDALTATTHISMLIDAIKSGIKTYVVHGSSILTAIAETGLSLYKFGRTVTVPLPEKGPVNTVIRTIKENQEHGLHTLVLLDLDIPNSRYLTIPQALDRLMEAGFPRDTLTVGVARLGSSTSIIRADTAQSIAELDFGEPPHALVVPGSLHFQEEKGLKILADCPDDLLKGRVVRGEVDQLIEKYSSSCRRVLSDVNFLNLPKDIDINDIRELLDHASRYLDDAEYYKAEQKPVALTSVAYAEGILDALKLLRLVEFEW
jgi:diphthine synthase